MYLAYLTLISGLFLSTISEFYSIMGLIAIFPANPIPVIVMGIALGVGKIVGTIWLKQNWKIAPLSIKIYLSSAICILVCITSLGIFGLLSKAHSDQSLISGNVQAQLLVYDEKIKVAKENIEANRKALKQLDEAVDQVMNRSTSEAGADKAVAIRKSQARDRARLLTEISAEQKTIAKLNEEAAPIRAEIRKIEAEVGPIKYIASFVYGETDQTVLEKAVTWVIILIVIVFDPLAVILLLASQISFQHFREQKEKDWGEKYFQDVADDLNEAFKDQFNKSAEGDSPEKESDVVSTATVTTSTSSILEVHPYLNQPFKNFENLKPLVHKPETQEDEEWQRWVEHGEIPDVERPGDYLTSTENSPLFVQNEEQRDSNLWSEITQEEYLRSAQERKNKG